MTLIFQTENSIYYIDNEKMQYMRQLKMGVGVGVVPSHRLVYGQWIPLKKAEVRPDGCLHIWAEDSVHGIITSKIIGTTTTAPVE